MRIMNQLRQRRTHNFVIVVHVMTEAGSTETNCRLGPGPQLLRRLRIHSSACTFSSSILALPHHQTIELDRVVSCTYCLWCAIGYLRPVVPFE